MADPRFRRGARLSPRHKLLAAEPFRHVRGIPATVTYVPKQLSMWDNDHDGDCVTAEEAFAKACFSPEVFISDQEVIRWASSHGVLNGADLSEVLDWMTQQGFQGSGNQLYNNGPKLGVDYSKPDVVRGAIASGLATGNPSPVKIAIDANALPSGAGNQQGWYSFGSGNYPNTDHCVSLAGYGTAGDCFKALGVPVPSGVDPNKPDCFLLFTWSTIGVVDHAWIMGTCAEAWVRTPTTIGVPPLPGPTPVPPAPPTPTPTPTPTPVPPGPTPVPPGPGPGPSPCPCPPEWDVSLTGTVTTLFGHEAVTLTGKAVPPIVPPSATSQMKCFSPSKGLDTTQPSHVLAVTNRLVSLGFPWQIIVQWLLTYGIQAVTEIIPVLISNWGKYTTAQLIAWGEAALAAIVSGLPLPPLPPVS